MNIGGFEKYSFIDYPGLISSVVFTAGCNFHCPYCHNPELVRPAGENSQAGPVSDVDILAFLEKRRKYVDGVVITGGEPTLQADLADWCRKIKALGMAVKLDTNGSFPRVLASLIGQGLVDYIAMDIKTDPARYEPYIATGIDPRQIEKSIEIVKSAGLPHEFRTTCVKPVIDKPAVQVIAELARGAGLYALQKPVISGKLLNPGFFNSHQRAFSDAELQSFQSILSDSVKQCIIR